MGINVNSVKHHFVNPSVLIKPIINMYHGVPNNSVYRQFCSDAKRLKYEPLSDVIKDAIKLMEKLKNERSADHEPRINKK